MYTVVLVRLFWGLFERRELLLDFFFLVILADSSLSEREDALAEEIFLICAAAIILSYLTLIVDRSSHQPS